MNDDLLKFRINDYGNEIRYSYEFNGKLYVIYIFKSLYTENEYKVINDLLCSMDIDNIIIAKAIINNKN